MSHNASPSGRPFGNQTTTMPGTRELSRLASCGSNDSSTRSVSFTRYLECVGATRSIGGCYSPWQGWPADQPVECNMDLGWVGIFRVPGVFGAKAVDKRLEIVLDPI